jgi:CheY-like chemotaxis protein
MIPDDKEEKAPKKKKLVLIIEDDHSVARELINLFSAYKKSLLLEVANDAGDGLRIIKNRKNDRRHDALILDIMMPYGRARGKLLKGRYDPDENTTGIYLLEYLRKKEKKDTAAPMWVAIITGRSPIVVGAKIEALIKNHGKTYYKPFSAIKLEYDLMMALGIPHKIPNGLI